MNDASEAKWLTFAELAQARGISEPSARKLVRRHKWRRQAGNQGIVRILVPAEAVDRPKDDPGTDLPHDLRPDLGTDPSDEPRAIIALEAAIAALREQLEAANARVERVEADRADERLRADRAETRAAALRDKLEALHADLTAAKALQVEVEAAMKDQIGAAQSALAAMRQAQADRKARGLLARLRAAVRGGVSVTDDDWPDATFMLSVTAWSVSIAAMRLARASRFTA